MNKYISILFKHWQTTVVGLLIATVTVMYYVGKIHTQDWAIAIGTVLTVGAFLMKDPNKTASKPD